MEKPTRSIDDTITENSFKLIEEGLENAKDKGNAYWKKAKEGGKSLWTDAQSNSQNTWGQTKNFIQKNPGQAIGIAVLLGVIGTIIFYPKGQN